MNENIERIEAALLRMIKTRQQSLVLFSLNFKGYFRFLSRLAKYVLKAF